MFMVCLFLVGSIILVHVLYVAGVVVFSNFLMFVIMYALGTLGMVASFAKHCTALPSKDDEPLV